MLGYLSLNIICSHKQTDNVRGQMKTCLYIPQFVTSPPLHIPEGWKKLSYSEYLIRPLRVVTSGRRQPSGYLHFLGGKLLVLVTCYGIESLKRNLVETNFNEKKPACFAVNDSITLWLLTALTLPKQMLRMVSSPLSIWDQEAKKF